MPLEITAPINIAYRLFPQLGLNWPHDAPGKEGALWYRVAAPIKTSDKTSRESGGTKELIR